MRGQIDQHGEGGYWECNDVHELKRGLDSITRAMDILEAALSTRQVELAGAKSPEELAQMIERIIKKKFDG